MTDALHERGHVVSWLLCEAFEHRFTPEIAKAYKRAADAIANGQHYTDTGRGDDLLRVVTCTAQASLLEELAEMSLRLAEEARRKAGGRG